MVSRQLNECSAAKHLDLIFVVKDVQKIDRERLLGSVLDIITKIVGYIELIHNEAVVKKSDADYIHQNDPLEPQ